MDGSKGWFESRSRFLQSLYRVLNSWNLPSNFPDLEKVWKIEVKSWTKLIVRSLDFFFLESYNKCFTGEIFFSCGSNLIQSRLHVIEKALFPRFFKVSMKEAACMVECSATTRNPAVPGSNPTLVTCWICSWSSLFKSLATLVNSQLVASCQLGFLILLCCIWIICF